MRTFRIILIVILMIAFTGVAMMPTEQPTIPETLCSSLNYRVVKKGNRYLVTDHGSTKTYFANASGEQPIQVQQALSSCRDELNDL